jgi:hypothetical protein
MKENQEIENIFSKPLFQRQKKKLIFFPSWYVKLESQIKFCFMKINHMTNIYVCVKNPYYKQVVHVF